MGAGRFKATTCSRPCNEREQRREAYLVATNKATDEKHQSVKMEARRAKFNHSRSISLYSANAAGRRAIMTTHRPSLKRGRVIRTISRNLLRVRLRVTALPMRREVIKPILLPGSESLSTLNTINFPGHELPELLIFANSEALASRADFGKQKRWGLESTRQLIEKEDLPEGKSQF